MVKDDTVKGILCILASAIGFAAMMVFAKLAIDVDPIQKTFYRNILVSAIALVFLIKNKTSLKIPPKARIPMLLRVICGTIGLTLAFVAVEMLYVADATLLQKLSPFVVIIASYFVLGEKVHKYQIAALLVAFIGVILVIKPGFGSFSIGAIIAIIGAIGGGFAYTFVRLSNKRGVDSGAIVFYFAMFAWVIYIPYMVMNFTPLSPYEMLIMLGIGISAAIGQYGITYAYSFAPGRSISVFEYSQVIFAALFAFIAFGEVPDALSWLGYAIVIAAGALLIFRTKRIQKQELKRDKA